MKNIFIEIFKRFVLTVMLVLLCTNIVKAQTDSLANAANPDDPRWYFSFGISAYSDYIAANPIKIPLTDSVHFYNDGFFRVSQMKTFNLATFTYQIRYNIFSINENASLSLSVPIALGLNSVKFSDGSRGFLSLSIPCMLQYNQGAASNFSTPKWKGWMIGAGAEFNLFPLVAKDKYSYLDEQLNEKSFIPSHQWIQPALEIAYRWINTDQNTREINFKFGYGISQQVSIDNKNYIPFSAKLTYLFFINY